MYAEMYVRPRIYAMGDPFQTRQKDVRTAGRLVTRALLDLRILLALSQLRTPCCDKNSFIPASGYLVIGSDKTLVTSVESLDVILPAPKLPPPQN